MRREPFGWREVTIGLSGAIAGIVVATAVFVVFVLRKDDSATPTTAPPHTVTVTATVTSPFVGGPVDSDVDRALFLDRANLPAGQEDAGLAAAKAWCAEVTATDGRIDDHGAVFERYPELDGYSGTDLIYAAVTVFCPEYTSHLPER